MEDARWAILLDLDQTLVLTSALLPLRQQRKWSQIYTLFHHTQLPAGTLQFLQRSQKLAHVGIITTSPRTYAEKLVAYHHLDVRVIVAYHDTKLHKPHPDPLLKAAEILQFPPTRCFYVGDTVEDIAAAISAKVIPIGLSWDGTLITPKGASRMCTLCKDWNEVLTFIMATISAEGESHGL